MWSGTSTTSAPEVGFWELIWDNVNVRYLWLGAVISLLGDWFNTIALYELVNELTGSPLALGMVFITKILPFAIVSPLAGLIADRLNRKGLMIASDLLRAVVVLGFLLVDERSDIVLLYVLATLQVSISAAFVPARNASIPNITTPQELLTANTLLSATWSFMLAMGAALGGLATEWVGVQGVFLIDSATYLLSAVAIYRTVIPQEKAEPRTASVIRSAVRDIVGGWKYLVNHPPVGRISPAKAIWAFGGGALVYMLALLGEELFPGVTAVGIGVLFAARGVGTGIGPLLARSWFRDKTQWPFILGSCVIFSGVWYIAVGLLPWTAWIITCVVLAHMASGANWVLSSVLLQERTTDSFRGRVFGTELLMVEIVDAASILLASLLLEAAWFDLRQGFLIFAAVQLVSGLIWLLVVVPLERRTESV